MLLLQREEDPSAPARYLSTLTHTGTPPAPRIYNAGMAGRQKGSPDARSFCAAGEMDGRGLAPMHTHHFLMDFAARKKNQRRGRGARREASLRERKRTGGVFCHQNNREDGQASRNKLTRVAGQSPPKSVDRRVMHDIRTTTIKTLAVEKMTFHSLSILFREDPLPSLAQKPQKTPT